MLRQAQSSLTCSYGNSAVRNKVVHMISIRIMKNDDRFYVVGSIDGIEDELLDWFENEADAKELVADLWADVVEDAEAKAGWDPNP